MQFGWLRREDALNLVLLGITVLLLYVCLRLAYPFFPALTWALALNVVAHPLHQWITERTRRPNLAAGLAVTIVALFLVAPAGLTSYGLINQTKGILDSAQAHTEGGKWRPILDRNRTMTRVLNFVERYINLRGITSRAANAATSWLSSFVESSVWSFVQLLLSFLTLFFLFRDRQFFVRKVKSLIPFSQAESDRVFSRVHNTIYATVYGTFVISLIQGALGGLIFWWLGLSAPLFWGVVMALLALIPVLGAPVVWVPAAIYLGLTGSWGKALILSTWGVIVIGYIDNLLYPVLVGNKMRMHTLLVLFSVLGGLTVFGAAGIILGPVTVVTTDVLVEMLARA